MIAAIIWDLRCPECDFEFQVCFPDSETEEDKKELQTCPCGSLMDIINEQVVRGDG